MPKKQSFIEFKLIVSTNSTIFQPLSLRKLKIKVVFQFMLSKHYFIALVHFKSIPGEWLDGWLELGLNWAKMMGVLAPKSTLHSAPNQQKQKTSRG
jgi:hypothetical protein